jgi:uncharacterized protein YndB with AHSA1/START domain
MSFCRRSFRYNREQELYREYGTCADDSPLAIPSTCTVGSNDSPTCSPYFNLSSLTIYRSTTMAKQTEIQPSPTRAEQFNKTIHINAPISRVWATLTTPVLMKKWMSETQIDIITDWVVGRPFLIRGQLHGIKFENKGTVLEFQREKILQYSHLSSLSRLPDKPENYSMLDFSLTPTGHQTSLALTLRNFPTESIYKHLAFYWNVTLEILKRMVEEQE